MNSFKRILPLHVDCPICGKPDWCLLAEDASAAICARIESPKKMGSAGWLHKLNGQVAAPPTSRARPALAAPPPDWGDKFDGFQAAMSLERRAAIAQDLHVSEESLFALRTGWSIENDALAFPMRDEQRRIVGFRLRTMRGDKFAVTGSRNALFIPCLEPLEDRVYICEGPTDCAALLTLGGGLFAVGRPSNTGAEEMIVRLFGRFERRRVREALILADRDENGSMGERTTLRGARQLAQALGRIGVRSTILRPPAKDMRAWVADGLTLTEFCHAVAEAV